MKSGGILRILNNSCEIRGNETDFTSGSIIEINGNLRVSNLFLNMNNTEIRKTDGEEPFFGKYLYPESANFTDLNLTLAVLSTSKKCQITVYGDVSLERVILEIYGDIVLSNNTVINTDLKPYFHGISITKEVPYIAIQSHGKIIIENAISLLKIPLWVKNGGIIEIGKNSIFEIDSGGKFENFAVLNISKSSEVNFENFLFFFNKLSIIEGFGTVNIKTVFYPPKILNSTVNVRVLSGGVLMYSNANNTNITLSSIITNKIIDYQNTTSSTEYIENNDDNNENNFCSKISIYPEGELRILRNKNLQHNLKINHINFYGGLINVSLNSTLIINNNCTMFNGIIKGEGLLRISKHGSLNLIPDNNVSSAVSGIIITNYGNINTYNNTINFRKYAIINNYGKIIFHGSQNWFNNGILLSYDTPFSINSNNGIDGVVYTDLSVDQCAYNCAYNDIILSLNNNNNNNNVERKACSAFLFNKKDQMCQLTYSPVQYVQYVQYRTVSSLPYSWDVYNKNNILLKSPKLINHENGTFEKNPEIISLSNSSSTIGVEFQNFGKIKIFENSVLQVEALFEQNLVGITEISGDLKLRKSSINGEINGNGTVTLLAVPSNKNELPSNNNELPSNSMYHNIYTSIISNNLKMYIFGDTIIKFNCSVINIEELIINKAIVKIIENNIFLNISTLIIKNNGKLISNITYIPPQSSVCNNTGNNIIFSLPLFSTCYDVVIASKNVLLINNSFLDFSHSLIYSENITISVNSSISCSGRGYKQNSNVSETVKDSYFGKYLIHYHFNSFFFFFI